MNEELLHSFFMKKACNLASKSVEYGSGPFGCVIVDYNKNIIIGEGHNKVLLESDPTLHAEIVAIKDACKNKKTHILDDCILYTSCEPCPMCLGAIYWSRIKTVYFGNNRIDAKKIGFDDSFIYEEVNKDVYNRSIKMIECENEYAKKSFIEWKNNNNKLY